MRRLVLSLSLSTPFSASCSTASGPTRTVEERPSLVVEQVSHHPPIVSLFLPWNSALPLTDADRLVIGPKLIDRPELTW